MMIRIHWKLTMMLIPGVFTVFAFHEKEGQGVTFSLSHFPYLEVTFSLSLDRTIGYAIINTRKQGTSTCPVRTEEGKIGCSGK